MKKVTLSALAAIAVAGTAFAGPTVVMSKEYKQPCVTPCFRDQEFQIDLFYSFNDAEHQGNNTASDTLLLGPAATPLSPLTFANPLLVDPTSTVIPAGSTVLQRQSAKVSVPQYFQDGSGGGVGANFFFARYFGIGVEGNWWDGARSGFNGSLDTSALVAVSGPVDPVAFAAAVEATNTSVTVNPDGTLVLRDRRSFGNTHRSVTHQVTGNLILRYPFEGPICWAPYIFGGGGGIFNGESTGFGDVGIGVEFRITPNLGFFTDWRWEFTSGGGDDEDTDVRRDSVIRNLRTVFGDTGVNSIRNVRSLESRDTNDVSMTRVGIRFAF